MGVLPGGFVPILLERLVRLLRRQAVPAADPVPVRPIGEVLAAPLPEALEGGLPPLRLHHGRSSALTTRWRTPWSPRPPEKTWSSPVSVLYHGAAGARLSMASLREPMILVGNRASDSRATTRG